MWILGPIAADRASNLVASFHFRVNILLVNSKIHEKMLKTSALKRSQSKLCYLQIDEVHWLMKGYSS